MGANLYGKVGPGWIVPGLNDKPAVPQTAEVVQPVAAPEPPPPPPPEPPDEPAVEHTEE